MMSNDPERILDLLPEMVSLVGTDERYIYANKAYQEHLGKTLLEIQGKTLCECLGKETYHSFSVQIKKVLYGQKVQFESTMKFPNGKLKHLMIEYIPQFNEANEVCSFLIFSRQIAKEILKTKNHSESEKMQETFFNVPNLMFCIAGNDGYFKKLNHTWELIVGYSVQELLASPFLNFVHPDDKERTFSEVAAISKGSTSFHFKNRYRCKDGNYKWIEWNSVNQDDLIYSVAQDITNIQSAELAVKESETKFRQWLESMPQIVWTFDEKGAETYHNKRWYEYTGIPIHQETPEKTNQVIHSEDLPKLQKKWNEAILKESVFEASYRLKNKDGIYRWHLGRASPIRNQEGKIIEWIGTSTDIHNEKDLIVEKMLAEANEMLAEANAKLSEERFKTILEHSPLPKALYGVDGRPTKVNRAFQEFWGLEDGTLLEHYYQKYNIFSDPILKRLGVEPYLQKACQGQVVSVPAVLYDPSETNFPGPSRWIETYFSSIQDKEGHFSELIVIFNDVTYRKQSEDSVRAKQQELQAIIDYSPAIIYVKDLEGRAMIVNAEYENIMGKKKEDVIGKIAHEMFPKEVALKYRENDLKVIYNAEPVKYEEEIKTAAGEIKTYFSIKFPIKNDKGSVVAVGGIATDITFEKKLELERSIAKISEETAKQTSQMKSSFLAIMSHEIRTPIAGVIGLSELLLDSSLNETQYSYTKTLKSTAENLLFIVNDILDLSKIEAGKMNIESIDFNLEQLIHTVVDSFQYITIKTPIELKSHISPNRHNWLRGDPNRIKQILMNLIGNAIKFTQKGSIQIDVQIKELSNQIIEMKCGVTDTGIGMSKETLSKLFQPYTQKDEATARRFGGTGLGLSICKKLVELMGGEIGATSEVGKGANFWFTLKLNHAVSLEKTENHELKAMNPKFENFKVLIVEDIPVNQMVIQRMLESLGIQTALAQNGVEAIEYLKTSKVDLVFMDCQMPEMDGFTATKIIRDDPLLNANHLPIIAMTANALNGDKERCLAAGMTDYISKPARKKDIIELVSRFVKKEQ